jgi:Tfp pilus assembly protein PilV
MKRHTPLNNAGWDKERQRRNPSVRSGTTLAETLVAMLVMSIGVVSLLSLFPISVLRSAQATQLTNATNLRYNAEARIDMNLAMLNAPTVAGVPTPTTWIIDPLGYNIAYATSGLATARKLGGATGLQRYNGGFTALTAIAGANAAQVTAAEIAAADVVTLPDSWTQQTTATAPTYTPTPVAAPTITFPASVDLTSVPVAAPYESRVEVFDTTQRVCEVRRITAIAGQVATLSAPLSTRLFEDLDGDGSVDAGEDYNGNTVLNNNIGEVLVETRDRRYTWMLSVRGNYERVNVDVVTFFGRAFTTQDETVYGCNFFPSRYLGADGLPGTADDVNLKGGDGAYGTKGIDDDLNGTIDDVSECGWPGSDDNRTAYSVTWVAGSKPSLRKGNFVLDAKRGRWYRIRSIYDPATSLPVSSFGEFTGTVVNLVLDKDIIEPTTDFTGYPATLNGSAIFMKGVVEVYPLGTKQLPQ